MNRRSFFKSFGKGVAAGVGVALVSKSLLADDSVKKFEEQNDIDVTLPKEGVAGSKWPENVEHLVRPCVYPKVGVNSFESGIVSGTWVIGYENERLDNDLVRHYGEDGGKVYDRTITYSHKPDDMTWKDWISLNSSNPKNTSYLIPQVERITHVGGNKVKRA